MKNYIGFRAFALLAFLITAAALVTSNVPAVNAQSPQNGPHIMHTRQWYQEQRQTSSPVPFGPVDNLAPGSGPTMHTMNAHLIFWDPNNNIPASYKNILAQYFTDVGGTPFYNIVTQYYDTVSGTTNIQNVVTYGGSWTDTANPYPHAGTTADPLLDSDIQDEVDAAISANGWATGLGNMFFVYTEKGIESCTDGTHTSCTPGFANPPNKNGYCAYHYNFNSGANERIYANMPYGGTWTGSGYCLNNNGYPNGSYRNDEDTEISVTSHEQIEAMTDPEPNSNWTDGSCGTKTNPLPCGEIGDKCAYDFSLVTPSADGSDMTLHGHHYNVQPEWSNAQFTALGTAQSGCALDYLPPGVTITKSDSPDPVIAGNNLIYTIVVPNNGAPTGETPNLSDTTPTHTTFFSMTPPAGWNCTNPPNGLTGTSTCTKTNGYMNNGESATFTFVVKVNSNTPSGATVNNTATVKWDTLYGVTVNNGGPQTNSASETTAVQTRADLSVTKSGVTNPVVAGTNESYNLTVTNNGPSDAQNVALTDATPPNTTFVSAAQNSGSAFTCSTPPVGGTGNVSCNLATLAAGTSASFTIVVHVKSGTAGGSTISNTANVSSSTSDPNTANNSSTVTVNVITRADLGMTKSQASQVVIADTNQIYTLTLVNNGPSDAQNVTLSDSTPANTTFVSLTQNTGPAFTCTTPPVGGTGNVSCAIATLTAGASASFTLVVRISPVDTNTITNTASASSSTIDPNSANNTATVKADDSIRKYKQNILSDLTALRSTVTNKQVGQKLDQAIQDLTNSLAPSLWVGGNTLEPRHGAMVFSAEKDAVVFMTDLIKTNNGGLASALQGLVNHVITADHGLAGIALHQAIIANGAANLIAQAQNELTQGDSDAGTGKFSVAIEDYQNAWQHAQQAMNK